MPHRNQVSDPSDSLCSDGPHSKVIKLANDQDIIYQDGETHLGMACKEGDLELARTLILRGADVNRGNNRREKPLHHACGRGHVGVVRLLCKHGAVLDTTNRLDETPFLICCRYGHFC